MTIRILKFVAVLIMSGPMFAGAAPVLSNSIAGDGEWGTIQFYHSGGRLEIDIWGNSYGGGENTGLDDPFITLMHDDGSPLTAFTGAWIASNDDSGLGYRDGTTSSLDSFLSVNIASSHYLLTISHCCQSFNASRDISDLASGVHGPYLDYQLTFTSMNPVRITAIDGVRVVPEPGSLALLGLGLFGLGCYRRAQLV